MSSIMKIANVSKLSIVISFNNIVIQKSQSIQVNPNETITIENTYGTCDIGLHFDVDSLDYIVNRQAWNKFWIEHDMPCDIYSIGRLSNTPSYHNRFILFESLYIEELMKISCDENGCFIFNTV